MEGPASPMDTSMDDPPTPTMDDHDDGPQSPNPNGPQSPAGVSMQEGPQSPTGPASPDMDQGPASPPQPRTPESPAQPQSPDSIADNDTKTSVVISPAAVTSASPPLSPSTQTAEQDTQDKADGISGDSASHEIGPNKETEAIQSKVSSSNLDLAKVQDDHGELDFDEELDEIDEKDKSAGERVLDKGKEEGEAAKDGVTVADPDDGQLSDQGSEEGEIIESSSSSDDLKSDEEDEAKAPRRRPPHQFSSSGPPAHSGPMPAPICRFFERGSCTWGINCRFLHPGVNDNMFGPPRRPGWVEEDLLPPPPPVSPPQESAWERGLRHAKKLREMASKRKEEEPDFEQKRMNLKVEEDGVEFNKENDRRGAHAKDPYYDQVYEDDYYDQERQAQESWGRGQYDNFEVQWSREQQAGPAMPAHRGGGHMYSKGGYPPHHGHPPSHPGAQQHPGMHYGGPVEHDEFGRDRFPGGGPGDRRRFPTPPERRFADAQMFRGRGRDMRHYSGPQDDHLLNYGMRNRDYGRPDRCLSRHRRPDDWERNGYPHYGPEHEHMGRGGPGPMMRDAPMMRGQRGEGDWKDPWARARSPKHGSPSRGRRRRRYRSRSGTFSSSSYSSSRSRSRSRSSGSYSSYSRSSYSRSSSYSSRSRSPSIPAAAKRPIGYKPPPHQLGPPPQHGAFGGRPGKVMPPKPSEAPRSQVSKPAPMPAQAPPSSKAPKKPTVGQVKLMVKRPEKPGLAPPPPQPKPKLPPGPLTGPMPGKKPSHRAQQPQDPLPGRSRLKDRQAKLKRGSGFSSSSSSSSSSRSRSRSSSASSVTSNSSSASGSSSGSADSDDLYRDIGKHDRRRTRATPPQPPLPPSPQKQHRERGSRVREHRKPPPPPSPSPRKMPQPHEDPRSKHAPPPPDPRRNSSRPEKGKSTSQPAAFRDVRESKDLMKLSGQKTGIKLTLVNKNDRDRSSRPVMPSSRMPEKRSMPSSHDDVPPAKRHHHQQRSPAKAEMPRQRVDPRSPKARPEAVKAPLPPAPAKTTPVKKRSATNRREELLKQLKAVENAIAKKRHK